MSYRGEDYGASDPDLRRLKIQHNQTHSKKALSDAGIAFAEMNNGHHLIVEHNGVRIDFYPGTGLWIERTGYRSRGVFRLIRFLHRQPKPL